MRNRSLLIIPIFTILLLTLFTGCTENQPTMKDIEDQTTMKDILVVAKIKEGKFQKFMGFMQSEEGISERKKIADLTKTLGTVSADRSAVMFKIAVHNEDALNSFLDGSNPISKPIFNEVMESYEIFELNKASHTMP